MRSLLFAKRNLKEIVRDPLSLLFCFIFPIGLLLMFQLIIGSMSEQEQNVVPQFQINNLAPSIVVFSFSFITLFSGMILSKDRTSSFLARIRTAPMKSFDFILGYTLPLLPIALIQVIVCYGFSLLFGLNLSFQLLLSIVTLIPIALLFIGLGLLLGTLLNEKALGGVASIIINLAALLSGMFMPLQNMKGVLVVIAYIFPFANSLKVTSSVIQGDFHILLPFLNVLVYTIIVLSLAVIVFKKKMSSDKG